MHATHFSPSTSAPILRRLPGSGHVFGVIVPLTFLGCVNDAHASRFSHCLKFLATSIVYLLRKIAQP